MADAWQYFDPLKEDPFYQICSICASKFAGWPKSTLEEHLETEHNLKVLRKPPNSSSNFPKYNEQDFLRKSTIVSLKRPRISNTVLTRRSKRRRITFTKFHDMLRRMPHIGEQIFDSLDNQSLLKCKEVSRLWYDFIDEQKFPWVRIFQTHVKESNKNYTECPQHWRKLFKKSSVDQVKDFTNKIHDSILHSRKHGFTFSCHEGREFAPMHFAAQFAYLPNFQIITHITKGFLNAEREKMPRDKDGNTPLHIAARYGNLNIIQLLLPAMEDKNPINNDGYTPLHNAAFQGRVIIVKLILENIIDKNPANKWRLTPLHFAASTGRFDVFKLIFDSVQEKNPRDNFGNTPLHKAAYGGDGTCKSCNPLKPNGKGNHPEICRFILRNVKETISENNEGKSPLLLAIESNHSSVIDILTP